MECKGFQEVSCLCGKVAYWKYLIIINRKSSLDHTLHNPWENSHNIMCFTLLGFFSSPWDIASKLFYVNFIAIIPNVPTVKDLHTRILRNPGWNFTGCIKTYFIIGYFNIKNYVIDESILPLFQQTRKKPKGILLSFFFFKEIILWNRSMLFQTQHYPLESHNLVSLYKEIQPIPNWWLILIGCL